MEHTFKIEKELKITTENIVDCVLSCEAGGFDYWGELCSDEKDYEAARQRLAEREKADMKPCYEDVLAEILESGGKLYTQLKIDDISNLGAVKIRIRSLMAAIEARKQK